MFSSRFKRHAAQFAISAALAVGTPAAAAGLVEGVRVAASTVDLAGYNPTAAPDVSIAAAPTTIQTATQEPTRLRVMVGPAAKPASAGNAALENHQSRRVQ